MCNILYMYIYICVCQERMQEYKNEQYILAHCKNVRKMHYILAKRDCENLKTMKFM